MKKILSRFSKIPPLSVKLAFGSLLLLLLVSIVMGSAVYFIESRRLREDSQQNMEQAVDGLYHMISQSLTHTISGQLQATADRNRDIFAYYYGQYKSGTYTEEEARARAEEVLLSQKIGSTGYLYALDSKGTLRMHPRAALVNVNISDREFIQKQMRWKNGYLEYNWKNPDEEVARPKALGMSYFKPWDLIISASAYRNEFSSVVNVRSFKKDIASVTFGATGYAYIIDIKGVLIVHPAMEGKNILGLLDADGNPFIKAMISKRNGKITYPWKNPGDTVARKKDVVFRYLPELDVIVAGGMYQDELYVPLDTLRNRLLAIFLFVVLLTMPLAIVVARQIGRPVLVLSGLAEKIAQRNLSDESAFNKLEAEQLQQRKWLGWSNAESTGLVKSLKAVSGSIRELISKLRFSAGILEQHQASIESTAGYSREAISEQGAMVGQVSSAIAELHQAFDQTRRMAEEMHTVAERAVLQVSEGRKAVFEAGESIHRASERSAGTLQQLERLGELTADIENAVQMVENLSAHSQILAVNASIEAAVAGEAGRGFSVVAGEVQGLAVQSVESTRMIREMLGRIRNTATAASRSTGDNHEAVTRGKEGIERVSVVITALENVIQLNLNRADTIARTVNEQSRAIEQISSAIHQVQGSATAGFENVETLLHSLGELRKTQSELATLVAQYNL